MQILFSKAVLTLCLLGIFSCSSSAPNQLQPAKNDNMGKNKIEWAVLDKGTQCALEQPRQAVVKTAQEFDKIWAETFMGVDMAPKKPAVDFSKDWVILAGLGMINKGGHQIDIADVSEANGVTTIALKHRQPKQGCMSTMSIEFPYIFARVSQFAGTPKFTTTDEEYSCE
ncbi:MAG: protease complex subunit PrcB family protein [Saprospiraceae bacterium]